MELNSRYDRKGRIAAVQAEPVFLDREATIDKACRLVAEAAAGGASIVAFPESFIPGYPYWLYLRRTPDEHAAWYVRYFHQSVDVPGLSLGRLQAAAQRHKVHVVVGVSERDQLRTALYSTNVVIDADGQIVGRHRKLVPTYAEMLVWDRGSGDTLKVYETPVGTLGTLVCGENLNSLARFSLLAQGEQIHVANHPASPFASHSDSYDLRLARRVRAIIPTAEGKIFCVVSSGYISEQTLRVVCETDEDRALLGGDSGCYTVVLGPDGRTLGELLDGEGICYADVNMADIVSARRRHNLLGYYNRFDIFSLRVRQEADEPLRRADLSWPAEPPTEGRPLTFTEAAEPR